MRILIIGGTAGQIYNVSESRAHTESEWIQRIAATVDWTGKIVPLEKEYLPGHLDHDFDLRQHMEIDSSKIRNDLGFREVTTPEEAVRRTVEWERRNPPKSVGRDTFDYEAEDAALVRVRREW